MIYFSYLTGALQMNDEGSETPAGPSPSPSQGPSLSPSQGPTRDVPTAAAQKAPRPNKPLPSHDLHDDVHHDVLPRPFQVRTVTACKPQTFHQDEKNRTV